MLVDCISDLHGFYPTLEGGDLLILAGDYTKTDDSKEWTQFFEWVCLHGTRRYKQVIFIGGNHDNFLQIAPSKDVKHFGLQYLQDSGTEFNGLKIWGSPWTLAFEGMNPSAKAFTVETEEELEEKWALIPYDIDILITHSASYGILDTLKLSRWNVRTHVGSESLTLEIAKRHSIKLHVFGHIHDSQGKQEGKNTIFVNASHVNGNDQPIHNAIRVVL